MASVPVTIVGTLTDKDGSQNVTIVGMAQITGLEVGGGPVQPPQIWPSPGRPAHPIAPGGEPPSIWPGPGDPDFPIQVPPSIWPDPPEGQAPIPGHPLPIPPPAGIQGPQLQVKVVWDADEGWSVVLVPTGTAPAPSVGRRG